FSFDGKRLALDLGEDAPRLYETATGMEQRSFAKNLRAQDKENFDLYLSAFLSRSRSGLRESSFTMGFMADGRILAHSRADGTITLWDIADGKEIACLKGHEGTVTTLAISPDDTTLASGSRDTTVLVWDLTGLRRNGLPAIPASDKKVSALWDELMNSDARKAYGAMWRLVAEPEAAVPMLRQSLSPAASADARVKELIADLGSEHFAVRKKATEELKSLAELARPALEDLLNWQPDSEVRRRAEQVLEAPVPVPSSKNLRALRAVEALELIGTLEARQVLGKVA